MKINGKGIFKLCKTEFFSSVIWGAVDLKVTKIVYFLKGNTEELQKYSKKYVDWDQYHEDTSKGMGNFDLKRMIVYRKFLPFLTGIHW